MTLQNFGPINLSRISNNGTFTTHDLDGSTDGAAVSFIAPRTGNIHKIGVNVASVTGTSPTYRLGIEGLSSGLPDGTYKASGTSHADTSGLSAGWQWVTLDADAAVTAGDALAATMRYQTGTVDASNFVRLNYCLTSNLASVGLPIPLTLTAGTWAAASVTRAAVFGVQYDDGSVVGGMFPISALTNQAWNSGSSPLFRGNLWTPQIGCRCIGFWTQMRSSGLNSAWNFSIYAGTDSSATTTTAVDASVAFPSGSPTYDIYIPLAPTTLTAGTAYRFVVEPTNANSNTTFVRHDFESATSLQEKFGAFTGTTASTAGSWTDTAGQFYPIVPIIDQIDDGAGSGTTIVLCGE